METSSDSCSICSVMLRVQRNVRVALEEMSNAWPSALASSRVFAAISSSSIVPPLRILACGCRSAAVAAHEFALRDDMALHGALDFGLGSPGLEIELGVERVQLEVVAVR